MTTHAATYTRLKEKLLPSVNKAYLEHDKSCASLDFFWFGRSGGVTAMGDIALCTGCKVHFYWEGIAETDEGYFCECCLRQGGHDGVLPSTA